MRRYLLVLAIISATLSFIAYARIDPRAPLHPRLTLTMFDVGQGDAILVRCGSHQTLIDGGPDDKVLAKIGRALPPYDRTLERIVLTHPHRDHFFGLIVILERYQVGELLLAQDDHSGDPEYARFLRTARDRGVPISRIFRGDTLDTGHCARLETLSPETSSDHEDPNDASVVLRLIRSGEPRALALLTGDATFEVERDLLARGDDLRASVLKVGHHGSRYSSSPAFLAAVAPDIALVSVAAKNRYGHPAYIVVERLARSSTRVFRTDRNGDVRLTFPERDPPVIRAAK